MLTDLLHGSEIRLSRSETESNRFGIAVERLVVPIASEDAQTVVRAMCAKSKSNLLIVRCVKGQVDFNSLSNELDAQFIDAGSLVYYSCQVRGWSALGTQQETYSVMERPLNELKSETVQLSFLNYRNHYSNNPRLSHFATSDAYVDWAIGLKSDARVRLFVAQEQASATQLGFALIKVLEDNTTAEIVLNGVRPEFRRIGVYSSMLAHAIKILASSNQICDLYISTQSVNTPVISAWLKLGFTAKFEVQTFHIMKNF